MGGDLEPVDLHRARSRRAQAGDVPVVHERDGRRRDDEVAFVDNGVAVDHDRAEEQPVGTLRAGRERPHALEPEPVGGLHGATAWPDHGRHHGVGIVAVDVVLSLGGEVRQQPRMGVHDPGDPRRGCAAAGQGGDHVEVVAHTEAEPAVAAALQHLERSGLPERLDVLLGQPPVGVGLLGPGAQLGNELDGPFEDCGRHRDSF